MGAGGLFGLQVLSRMATTRRQRRSEARPAQAPEGRAIPTSANLKPLPPIVTNLASPKGTWIRLEASIVVDAERRRGERARRDDHRGHRRLPAHACRSRRSRVASGFLHLREDLNDRARIRSGGKIARSGHPGHGARMNRLVGALLISCWLASARGRGPGAQAWSRSSPAGDATAAGRIVQLILVITVLSVAPGLLIMVTCFTRFVVALSFLRAGLGLQTTPANLILISLALFMTFYVMGPTFDKAWQGGVQPLMENKISEQEAYHAHQHAVPRVHAQPTCATRT